MAVAICGFDKRRGPPDFRQAENHNGEAVKPVWDLLSIGYRKSAVLAGKVSSIDQKPQRMGGLSTEKEKEVLRVSGKISKGETEQMIVNDLPFLGALGFPDDRQG
jgi:hypothetical protein